MGGADAARRSSTRRGLRLERARHPRPKPDPAAALSWDAGSMAGFLTRFAARLDGESEGTLRPRTRSLVEPVATTTFTPAGGAAAAEQQLPATDFERADEVDAPAVAAPSPVAARISSSRSAERHFGRRRTAAALNRADPSRSRNPAANLRRRGSRLAVHAGRPTCRPDRAVADPRHRQRPMRRRRVSNAIRPAGKVASPRGIPTHPVRGVEPIEEIAARPVVVRRGTTRPSSPRSDATGPAADDRRDMTAAASPPTLGVTGILQAPVVARLASEPLLSIRRAPQSEPTVHVTIGRVEGRAVTASPSDGARPGHLRR